MIQLEENYLKALEAAVLASGEIMRIYQTSFLKNFKSDGSPVTEADTASSKIIVKKLEILGIPIICEEDQVPAFEERKLWKDVWLVDPLDGTKEFIRRNGEFAVNIALVREGQPIFGLIASPMNQRVVFGGKEIGTFVCQYAEIADSSKWIRLHAQEINSPILMASSRTPYRGMELEFIAEMNQIDKVEFVKKGSALKFFDLAEGTADVYPRFAPTMEWDIASGQAILEGLNGEVIEFETGMPLQYNKESLYNPHFIAKTKGFIEVFN